MIVVHLIELFPHLEKNVGFKTQSLYGGVVDEDVVLQSIKIYAPNEDGDKVINVIGNAYVEDEVKHISPC